MIKVHGVHGSPYVRKVLVALEIKDVPYEIVRQMPFSGDAEYLQISLPPSHGRLTLMSSPPMGSSNHIRSSVRRKLSGAPRRKTLFNSEVGGTGTR